MRLKTANDYGHLIRLARRRRGWSQTELARRMGSNQAWVSKIENGKGSASLGLVIRALAVLGVQVTATTDPQHVSDSDDQLLDDIVEGR